MTPTPFQFGTAPTAGPPSLAPALSAGSQPRNSYTESLENELLSLKREKFDLQKALDELRLQSQEGQSKDGTEGGGGDVGAGIPEGALTLADLNKVQRADPSSDANIQDRGEAYRVPGSPFLVYHASNALERRCAQVSIFNGSNLHFPQDYLDLTSALHVPLPLTYLTHAAFSYPDEREWTFKGWRKALEEDSLTLSVGYERDVVMSPVNWSFAFQKYARCLATPMPTPSPLTPNLLVVYAASSPTSSENGSTSRF